MGLTFISIKMTRQMMLFLLVLIFAATVNSSSRCTMPVSWRGGWFHSGVTSTVTIDEDSISFKGVCRQNSGDRYLMLDKQNGCYRCLVIHAKHQNVLQYKETLCYNVESLTHVCNQLTGDAQLHSMFREGAAPVECPLPHTYAFTYSRGQAECSYPLSTVDSCTEGWRMLFRYQACPDIKGTESTTEEFMCLAAWKEGSNRYLVGKSDHDHATSDEDRYRCFVYDSWSNSSHSGFMMAQSGDATCNGLFSITAGSRTLALTKVDTSGSKCRFPTWVGGPHWHSLDGHATLHVTRRNSTLRLTGHSAAGPVTHACFEPSSHTKTSATYITRVIHGCTSGYQCVRILGRDTHVLEVLMGKTTPVAKDACGPNFFDPSSTNYTTFVSGNAEKRNCPGKGKYKITGNRRGSNNNGALVIASENTAARASTSANNRGSRGSENGVGTTSTRGTNLGGTGGGFSTGGLGSELAINNPLPCASGAYTFLSVGCITSDKIEIQSTCSYAEEYSCHGTWEEEGRQYLVVTPISRSSKGVRRLCLVLDQGAGVLSVASSTYSCSRDLIPGFHGHIALNTTSIGGCDELRPDIAGAAIQSLSVPLFAALLLMYFKEFVDSIRVRFLWT